MSANTFRSIKKIAVLFISIGISIMLLLFVITGTWIGFEVKQVCATAKRNYSGECVNALIAQLDDTQNSFYDRNKAIWALGQLGDSKALPTLQKYDTGNIPDREPLNETISQYELKKAIKLIEGGLNITAFLWRGF